MAQVLDPSLVERARTALDNHAWREAFELLTEADANGQLEPDELELLAQASWWVGQLPAAIAARERAYSAYTKAGDTISAALTAVQLGYNNLTRSAFSVAAGWLSRADRLLDQVEEHPAHGWLAVTRSLQSAISGNLEDAIASARRAHEIAVRFGDRELEILALTNQGVALVSSGRPEEGVPLLDEATVAAVGGELRPLTAGGVSCATIGACANMGDWLRAAEWTEAQDRWCQREHINGFPGMCRLHRAEIKRLRGSWLEAESDARRASEELKGFIPFGVGQALYEIGELRLRRGDLPAAEEALLAAIDYGRDPEPALSLLRLAQGNVDAARVSIKRALDEPATQPSWWIPPNTEVHRLSLLPAYVDVSLAARDVGAAREAADELSGLAERFGTTSAKASGAVANGSVRLAEGDPAGAAQALRLAVKTWGELDAPYEGARARVLLAQAYAAEANPERAVVELQSARTTFERLGAIRDLRMANQALAALKESGQATAVRSGRAERVARAFVFTDIVDSTKLAELLGDEAWNNLIRWHDHAIRTLVAEHKGEEIKATGDGFFLAFDDVDNAVECAIAIQRRLTEQRKTQGFAPAVRIGVHWAEANRQGLDYIGSGVNQAARVGGHAGAGEILVS